MAKNIWIAGALFAVFTASFAQAEEPAAPSESTPAPAPAANNPYSLPWQLRPVAPGNVVRLDNSLDFYDGGSTVASLLTGSYKVTKDLAPFLRLGFVNSSPEGGDSALSFTNPAVGGLYGVKLGDDMKLGLFLGVTAPIGSGGGDEPDLAKAVANGAGMVARAAMDNAMFAVDYMTFIPGIDFAYVKGGFTAQAELTVFPMIKMRADTSKDGFLFNTTSGLHLGYFIIPELSLGGEFRYQRFLKAKEAVTDDAAKDNMTFAVGPRAHFKLGDSMWFRPGIAYSRFLDAPTSDLGHNIIQIDLPFAF